MKPICNGLQFLIIFFALLMPATANSNPIEKVIIEGVGSSLDRAIQNAAERALMQVVGVYVDTETLISKRKEIKDGVKTETKTINKDLLQVSNGSIKNIDILEVSQDGDIYRVESLVEVRVDNVKILIKPFTVAKANVSKGLFATINKNKQQADDKITLINKRIIQPSLSGKHVEIKITGIQPLGDESSLLPTWLEVPSDLRQNPNFLPRSFEYFEGSGRDAKKYFDDQANRLKRTLNSDESVVVLGIETRLSDDFQNQVTSILEQVATKKFSYNWTNRAGGREFKEGLAEAKSDRIICTFLPMVLTCYVIDFDKPINYSKRMDVDGYLSDKWDENVDRNLTYRIRVSLMGADEGDVVLSDLVTYSSSAAPDKDLKYQFHSSSSRKNNRHINSLRAFSYMIESRTLPDNGAVFIPYVSGDLIYARLKDDQIAKVQSVEFSIEASEEFIKQTAGE